MKPLRTESFVIAEQPGLDPVSVFIQVFEESPQRTAVRVTVAVYEEAWTACFNGMGGAWHEFLARCSPDYLANALIRGTTTRTKAKYVERIARAVSSFLAQTQIYDVAPSTSVESHERLPRFAAVLTDLQRSLEHTTHAFAGARELAKSWGLIPQADRDSAESQSGMGGG